MMDLVDYINELLDIVHYTWFLSYYVRSPRYHLDNENDIMILHKLFVVLVWLVINFLGKGRCEMSIEDLHRDVLELRKLIGEMTTTIATQNSRIAYLQRTLNRQRSYCHREKLQKEVQDTKGSINYSVAKNNPNTIVMTNNGSGVVSSNRGDFRSSGRRPSVETPQLPFQPSLVRKGTYKTSLVDVLYTMKNNSSIGTSLGLNFLSSRENVFFSRLALTEKADQCSDWQFVSFHRSLYRAVVDTPAHSATTPLTQRHSLLRLSVLRRCPPWTGTDSEIRRRENKRRKWVPPKLRDFYRPRNRLLRLQLDVEDQTLR